MAILQNFKKAVNVDDVIKEIDKLCNEDNINSEIAFESSIYGLDDKYYEDDELDADLGEDEDEPFTFVEEDEIDVDSSVLEELDFGEDDEELSSDLETIAKSIYDDSLDDEEDDDF